MDRQDWYAAGKRCQNLSVESATDCFWSIAENQDLESCESTWDMFWSGYYNI